MRRGSRHRRLAGVVAGSVLGLSLLRPAPARGQEAITTRLSLDEAVRRSERASDEILLARYGVDAARAAQLQARSGFFPRISLSAAYDRTLATEFDAVFAAPAGGEVESGFDVENLPFGRENAYRASAVVSQNVFAGGRTLALTNRAGALLQRSEIDLAAARAENRLATVEAYYDALLGDDFVRIAERTLEQAQVTLERVRLSRREGQESEFELLRAQVALDNQRPNLEASRMQRDLAYLRLRQRLGLPAQTSLELTTSLDVDGAGGGELVSAARERAPVTQARQDVGASRFSVSAAQAGYYPSLDVSMSYGKVNYPADTLPDWDDWRTNWTVTALVSWPLFEGLLTRGQELAARAELGRAEVRLGSTRKLAEYEAEQVALEVRSAAAVFEASAGTTEQARRAYAIAELRFQEGVSTQLELSDARLSLAQAETNRARAARDLRVARMRRALLVDLPLSSLPATSAVRSGAAGVTTSPAPAGTAVTPSAGSPSSPAAAASSRGF